MGTCPFAVLDEIASGGMGTVYRAVGIEAPYTGRVVALKRLHPHLTRDAHVSQMFVEEARVIAGLRHPNVVEVIAYGQDVVGTYIALQYVAGVALSDLLRAAAAARQLVPVGVALHIIARIADGLHAAHELTDARGEPRHLVHRDVSPQNILVGVEGDVVLVDFGVAKVRDAVAHTRTGILKGKPAYMSPEQVQGHPIDRRTDVFALGIVLWETLTLHRLYRGESEIDSLRKILSDPPEPVGGLRRDVSPALDQLLFAALSKDPSARIASCAEFAARLRELAEHHGGGPEEVVRFFTRVLPDRHAALSVPVAHELSTAELLDATLVSGARRRVGAPPVGARSRAVPVALAVTLALCVAVTLALRWRGSPPSAAVRAPAVTAAAAIVARPPAQPLPTPPAVAAPPATVDARRALAIVAPAPRAAPNARAHRVVPASPRPRARTSRAAPGGASSARGAGSLLSRSWDDQ